MYKTLKEKGHAAPINTGERVGMPRRFNVHIDFILKTLGQFCRWRLYTFPQSQKSVQIYYTENALYRQEDRGILFEFVDNG